jgi:hypothetical protein
MKYLKYRQEYLLESSGPLANDLPWGDTLLGRLINSTIRKAKIGTNLVSIESVIDRLKDEFDKLISAGVTKEMDDKSRTMISRIQFSAILGELEKAVNDGDQLQVIINITNHLIIEVTHFKVTKDGEETKKELIDKLKEFLSLISDADEADIENIKKDPDPVKDTDPKQLNPAPETKEIEGDKKNVKYLNAAPNTLLKKETSVDTKKGSEVSTILNSKENSSTKITKIENKIASLEKIISDKKSKNENTEQEENELKAFKDGLGKIKNESKIYRYIDFIIEELTDAPNIPSGKDSSGQKVREIFYRVFTKEYLLKWEISEQSAKELDKRMEDTSKSITKLELNIDPIVEIVKIFNKAHKIHTTPTIQSGRTDGKVSNKTFREYTWVGDGQPGTPAAPSVGAWRNNAIFDKWENSVLDIIKNPKYQVVFNEKTVFKFGDADERANLKKVSGSKPIQGGGKTLLKFMNEMLDGEKLYKKGTQLRFIEEYFGVQTSEKDLGFGGGNSPTPSKSKKEELIFIKESIENRKGSIYALTFKEGEKEKVYYLSIIQSNDDMIYFTCSHTFAEFKTMINRTPISPGSTGILVTKGDMEMPINTNTSFKSEKGNNLSYVTHYGSFKESDISKIPLIFKTISIKDSASKNSSIKCNIFKLVKKSDQTPVVLIDSDIEKISAAIDKVKDKLK